MHEDISQEQREEDPLDEGIESKALSPAEEEVLRAAEEDPLDELIERNAISPDEDVLRAVDTEEMVERKALSPDEEEVLREIVNLLVDDQ